MEKLVQLKKSLGQNFLIDANIIEKIVSSFSVVDNSIIIEIGPGSGMLTKKLITLDKPVICFEIDKRMKEYLNKIECSNLNVIYEDFLSVDLKKVLSDYKYENIYIVANIPYYITTAIINKVVKEIKVKEMILMMQKEVGDRILSSPNNKSYNSLSVFLQYYFDITKVMNVSKNSFFPKPKVDSVILKFTTNNKKYKVKDERIFFKLIKDSFQFKRKNLRNNLKKYNLENIEKILVKHNKNLTFRAESVTIEEFIDIANGL
jgi:16S rRNA (adenine1518-N6/adenine1519-N6)-dimethyltransferase